MAWTGNNAGVGTFGRVQSILCGIGFWGVSLYGGTIGNLSTEFCGVGYTLGLRFTVAIGYEFSNTYFEGNKFDYVQQWVQSLPLQRINNSHIDNFDKFAELYSYRIHFYYAAEGGYRAQSAFSRSSFYINSRTYEQKAAIHDVLDITLPDDVVYVNNNGGELAIKTTSANKLGMLHKTVVVLGEGVNKAPATDIVITCPSGWTVNGVLDATVTIPAQAKSVVFFVTHNVLEKTIDIFGDSILRTKGTTAQRPSKAPDGFVYLDTTLTVTTGKPVYKSGVDWVDNTGSVV